MLVEISDTEIINVNVPDLLYFKKGVYEDDYTKKPYLQWQHKYDRSCWEHVFQSKEMRNATFNLIKKELFKINSQQKERKFNPMKTLKDYFEKHQDTIITLGVVWLVDYYLFDGKFQDKIKNMVDKLLGNVEKKLLNESDKGTK